MPPHCDCWDSCRIDRCARPRLYWYNGQYWPTSFILHQRVISASFRPPSPWRGPRTAHVPPCWRWSMLVYTGIRFRFRFISIVDRKLKTTEYHTTWKADDRARWWCIAMRHAAEEDLLIAGNDSVPISTCRFGYTCSTDCPLVLFHVLFYGAQRSSINVSYAVHCIARMYDILWNLYVRYIILPYVTCVKRTLYKINETTVHHC